MTLSPDEFAEDFAPSARPGIRRLLARDAAAGVRLLAPPGPGPGVVSARGFTPLFLASLIADREAVEGLLAAGAPPDGDPRFAPVHAAVALRDTAILARLLAAGANPDGREGTRPALLHAAVLGNRPAVELLLARGARIDVTNSVGATAAIDAAAAGHWSLVELLLDRGASPWAVTTGGSTIASVAFRSRLGTGTEDGAARPRVIARLAAAGWPWPPPDAPTARALVQQGRWPPPPR